jgi:hypothetical protein
VNEFFPIRSSFAIPCSFFSVRNSLKRPEHRVRSVLHEIDLLLRAPDRVEDHVGAEGRLELFGERDHGLFDVAVRVRGDVRGLRLACEFEAVARGEAPVFAELLNPLVRRPDLRLVNEDATVQEELLTTPLFGIGLVAVHEVHLLRPRTCVATPSARPMLLAARASAVRFGFSESSMI